MTKVWEKILLTLLFIPFLNSAQVSIESFTVQPINSSQLNITWTVGASSLACSDLELFWSTDSFKTTSSMIYTVPTTVGTSGAAEYYYFQHNQPDANGKNFYKLVSYGATVSQIIIYDFGQDNGSYVIYPHPLNDNSLLTFKNPEGESWILDISNASCTERYMQYNIVAEQTPLPLSWFKQTGIYFFRMYTASGKLIKGKFVVMY